MVISSDLLRSRPSNQGRMEDQANVMRVRLYWSATIHVKCLVEQGVDVLDIAEMTQ